MILHLRHNSYKRGEGMNNTEKIKKALQESAELEKAEFLPGFFKAVPGGYGEGDLFLGVRVPLQRKVAKKYYKHISLDELKKLLQEPVHEYRFTALVMLVHQFQKAKDPEEKGIIANFYLKHLDYVNNWDLVNASAYKILGAYLIDQDRSILYELAASKDLWKQRVSIIATLYFIARNDYGDTLEIAKELLHHEHDLIHKAVGWMLREVGNRDFETEYRFLEKYYSAMPRTMLRYAIEKFDPELRQEFLKGRI